MAASGVTFRGSSSRRWWQPVCSLVLAGAVGLTAFPAQAGPPDAGEVERLYVEGQERAESKDYKGAADSWTRLLTAVPESGDNQAIRESVIINVLDAHMNAHNQLVDGSGKKDITHLRTGKSTLDAYYGEFKRVHGDRVGVSAAVQDKAAELEAALAAAEKAGTGGGAVEPDPGQPEVRPEGSNGGQDKGGKQVIVLQAQSNGTGLIVGGAVLGALGIGTLVMIPVGSIISGRAETEFEEATDQDGRDEATKDGNRGDALLISGAVLTPLLWGGAAAMIIFGIRNRRRAKEEQQRAIETVRATPTFTHDSAGFSLTGRF